MLVFFNGKKSNFCKLHSRKNSLHSKSSWRNRLNRAHKFFCRSWSNEEIYCSFSELSAFEILKLIRLSECFTHLNVNISNYIGLIMFSFYDEQHIVSKLQFDMFVSPYLNRDKYREFLKIYYPDVL